LKIRHKKSDQIVPQTAPDTLPARTAVAQFKPLLRLENMTKHYPGTLALDAVNLDVRPGEVHALFGENGAGKSTIIQIIAGVIKPTSGKIYLNGEEVIIGSVQHARELGISAVFQEFSLIPQMTVEENLFLGSEEMIGPFLRKANLHLRAEEALDRLGFALPTGKKIMHLSRAEQQMVEIAKAFRTKPSIMILDEPTASLTELEANQLYLMIEVLKREGIGVIYISHRVNEIYRISDRITILRDGKHIKTAPVSDIAEEQLVELTVGRHIDKVFPQINSQAGRMLLDVRNLNLANKYVNDVSINVRAGEVVGIAGLVGSGKSQIGRACFGLNKITSGQISYLDDQVYNNDLRINDLTPRATLDRGMLYLPSDRRSEGLVMMQSVRENVSLPSLSLEKFSSGLFLNRQSERSVVSEVVQRLGLNPHSIERPLEQLSGGNQQKVLVAKSLVRDVKLFILDEPTVGVDIGARASIYRLIQDVCEAGAGVLLISSDLSEIVNLTHRTYVMHRGELRAELSQDDLAEQTLLNYIFEQKVVA
jgi:ribose transport system ATP-binding protein